MTVYVVVVLSFGVGHGKHDRCGQEHGQSYGRHES